MTANCSMQIVNFTVGSTDYGVPVEQVREVREIQPVTPIPGTPDYIEGVTNLRGQVVTILNLKKRLGLPNEVDGNSKIVIIETDRLAAGIMVDSVSDVSSIADSDIENQLSVSLTNSDYIIGVGKQAGKLVIILNLAKIIKSDKKLSET